jgi:hypothetical protein
LNALDYVNALYWIFGISAEVVPDQLRAIQKLLQERERYCQLIKAARKRKQRLVVSNVEEIVREYGEAAERLRANKEMWKGGPIKILCSEQELTQIALSIKEHGSVSFTKDELQMRFDFSRVINSWERVPNYTLFFLGGGVRVSSPEFDLFDAMCWFHDEAIRTYQEGIQYGKNIGGDGFDEVTYMKVSTHSIMCRQAVINAFLFTEAFLNSLATACLSDPVMNLTEEQRLYLSEETRDDTGKIRQKHVSIQDKLYEWVRIMSPRGDTFERGKNPYQAFMKIKVYRDSLVHLSGQKKVDRFRAINLDVAKKAVFTAIEIVKKTSQFVSPNENDTHYPWWITGPNDDGFFNVSRDIKLKYTKPM